MKFGRNSHFFRTHRQFTRTFTRPGIDSHLYRQKHPPTKNRARGVRKLYYTTEQRTFVSPLPSYCHPHRIRSTPLPLFNCDRRGSSFQTKLSGIPPKYVILIPLLLLRNERKYPPLVGPVIIIQLQLHSRSHIKGVIRGSSSLLGMKIAHPFLLNMTSMTEMVYR